MRPRGAPFRFWWSFFQKAPAGVGRGAQLEVFCLAFFQKSEWVAGRRPADTAFLFCKAFFFVAGKPPRAMSAFVYLESHIIPRGWRPENLREGRPLPYGGIILFACRGGVPPPVKQISIAIFYRNGQSRTPVPTGLCDASLHPLTESRPLPGGALDTAPLHPLTERKFLYCFTVFVGLLLYRTILLAIKLYKCKIVIAFHSSSGLDTRRTASFTSEMEYP